MKNQCFWCPFWLHFGSLQAYMFDTFSASIFRCLFGWLFFLIFWRKWSPKGSGARARGRPKTLQKRIRDATSIFHRFGIDLGSHFCHIFMFSQPSAAPKRSENASATQLLCLVGFGIHFGHFFNSFGLLFSVDVAEACRFLVFHLLASRGRCPWGAAVSLCVYNPPTLKV